MRQFFSNWLGSGRTSARGHRRHTARPLTLEPLEDRTVPRVSFNFLTGQLRVVPEGASEQVVVLMDESSNIVVHEDGPQRLPSETRWWTIGLTSVWIGTNSTGHAFSTIWLKNLPRWLAVSVDGGSSLDNILTVDDGTNTWHITGTDSGDVNGHIYFTAVEDLVGNDNPDRFVFSDGQLITESIDGGDGSDTLDFSAWTTPLDSVVNATRHLSSNHGWVVDGYRHHVVTPGTVVSNWKVYESYSHVESIIGGQGTDTLRLDRNFDTVRITGVNEGSVNDEVPFSSFENAAFDDSTGYDEHRVLMISGSLSGRVSGGEITLDYSQSMGTALVNLVGGWADDLGSFDPLEIDHVIGGPFVDNLIATGIWFITEVDGGAVSVPNQWSHEFSSFEALISDTGPSMFLFQGGRISGLIIGGGPCDLLDYSQYTSPVTVNLMQLSAPDVGLVGGIEVVKGTNWADTLTGDASAPTMLIGLNGNDTLSGGQGRDVLIGGTGADWLDGDGVFGGDGEDILIDGTTSYDNFSGLSNAVDLVSILERWARTDRTYGQRIADIRNPAAGARLDHTTVKSDSDVDTLRGQGGQDWFWAVAGLISQPGKPRDSLPDWTRVATGTRIVVESIN